MTCAWKASRLVNGWTLPIQCRVLTLLCCDYCCVMHCWYEEHTVRTRSCKAQTFHGHKWARTLQCRMCTSLQHWTPGTCIQELLGQPACMSTGTAGFLKYQEYGYTQLNCQCISMQQSNAHTSSNYFHPCWVAFAACQLLRLLLPENTMSLLTCYFFRNQ